MDDAGVFFDGQSNRRRVVELRFSGGLDIREDGRIVASWPYGDVRRVDAPGDAMRLFFPT